MGSELTSNIPFEAGPEYKDMISQMIHPGSGHSLSQDQFKKTLRPSNLLHSPLEQTILNEDSPSEEYFGGPNVNEIHPENEYGQLNCLDIRDYLKPFARDAEHLCQLLIEHKMGRLDIMDKISEEHSMDLDNSVITHAMNKSIVLGKEPKLLHSDSCWLGSKQGNGLNRRHPECDQHFVQFEEGDSPEYLEHLESLVSGTELILSTDHFAGGSWLFSRR